MSAKTIHQCTSIVVCALQHNKARAVWFIEIVPGKLMELLKVTKSQKHFSWNFIAQINEIFDKIVESCEKQSKRKAKFFLSCHTAIYFQISICKKILATNFMIQTVVFATGRIKASGCVPHWTCFFDVVAGWPDQWPPYGVHLSRAGGRSKNKGARGE